MQEFQMTKPDDDPHSDRLEEAIALLTQLNTPAPKSWWDKVPFGQARDLIFLIGIPVALWTAYVEFDEYYLSRAEFRLEEQRDTAIARLDQLQSINSEIYRLQTQGEGNVAFALIEAKKGQIARLTDTVYQAWVDQPAMLRHHDLNALAEALLVQERHSDALRVANAVSVAQLRPIDAIDQQILKARIQFDLGDAHDIEAARQHLRDAVPLVDEIAREGNKFLMQEKMLQVRLLNEGWLGEPCDALMPMAEGLTELRAFNAAAGSVEDTFGSQMTVEAVMAQCAPSE